MKAADIVHILDGAPEPDSVITTALAARAADVLRPAGALARLDEVAIWLGGWQRTTVPAVHKPMVLLFAADHGVARDGVSAYPAEVTAAMCRAVEAGVATVSAMAVAVGAVVELVDVGVGNPTANLRVEAALGDSRFVDAFEEGRAAVARGDTDLLILGEMGIGNTTAAAAVSASLAARAGDWVGAGTGVAGEALRNKRRIVDEAVKRIAGITDPIEILRQVGGAEMVAMAGAAVEARMRSIPVLLDGYIVTAALFALEKARPGALDHCLAGHVSSEPGHRRLLEMLDRRPLLQLDLGLGEGSGALAALPLVRLAAAGITNVATFKEFGLYR